MTTTIEALHDELLFLEPADAFDDPEYARKRIAEIRVTLDGEYRIDYASRADWEAGKPKSAERRDYDERGNLTACTPVAIDDPILDDERMEWREVEDTDGSVPYSIGTVLP